MRQEHGIGNAVGNAADPSQWMGHGVANAKAGVVKAMPARRWHTAGRRERPIACDRRVKLARDRLHGMQGLRRR